MKKYKTKINPKIAKVAKSLGLDLRVGPTPASVGILGVEKSFKEVAAYFGEGVIFVRDRTYYRSQELDFVFLHEVGHAIVDYFLGDRITTKMHEVKANAVALGFAAILSISVSDRMLKNCVTYTVTKNKDFKTIKIQRFRRKA